MPFRLNRTTRPEPLEQQGRGGEPSLAIFVAQMDRANKLHEEGRGKAAGSFTEHLRREFVAWRKAKGWSWRTPLTFEYRLHRRRTVMVVLDMPHIRHNKLVGDGSKGFMLEGNILAIDGVQPEAYLRRYGFALTRIVGRFRQELLALAAPLST